ncbi:MAG: helix-turn-helix transcriptional regulator [Asgard group archaeon]|nr:helix-turn-helix transcriptional regulator [Asgard group archaeon]
MSNKKEMKGNHKDFIDFEPEIIKFLTDEQHFTTLKYQPIIAALRNKPMTPKEIHELYYNEDSKAYTCSIKSIYRYLEKLEDADLIRVAGYRITEGKRVSENLFLRTAQIFSKKNVNPNHPSAVKKRNMIKENLRVILEETSDSDIKDFEGFKEIIEKWLLFEIQYSREIVKKIPSSERLKDRFSKLDMEFINYLNEFASRILILIEHPDLIAKIQKIFSD